MDSSGDGGDESAGVGKPESPAPALAPAAGGGASASGSGGKPAVKRVMKTPYQLEVLEKTYTDDPYPNETLRVELSVKLGLTDRQLQMWFCHRRLKDRKPQREEEVAVPVIAPPPVLPPSLPHCELTVGSAGTHAEQLLPCSRRGPGRSSAVPRISVPEIGRRYYEPPQVMLPPLAPIQLTRAELRVIDSVQELIGEPLREDGPVLGVEFGPIPPGAFGAPIACLNIFEYSMSGKPSDDTTCQVRPEGDISDVKVETANQNEGDGMPSPREEEAAIKKKYGGIVPRKPPLISKDHERAYFDSADWALGKPTQQQARPRRFPYACADNEERTSPNQDSTEGKDKE